MADDAAGHNATGYDAAGHDAETCAHAWFVLKDAHARVADCLRLALGRECGLGVSEFEVLLRLDRAGPAPQRIGSLRTASDLSQPAMSRLVDRLHRRGLVERTRSGADQRAVAVGLTEAGRAMLRRAVPIHAACVSEQLLRRLASEERATLVAILGRITEPD